MNIFEDMVRFMHACGCTTDENNIVQAALYKRLETEEKVELEEARDNEDEVAEAGELIDLIYVLVGYGFSRGWPLERLWAEIHGANMRKVDPVTGQVRRREDGKILKPEGWKPADIQAVMAAHAAQREVLRKYLAR